MFSAYRNLVQNICAVINGKIHLPMKRFGDQSLGSVPKIDLCIVAIKYTVVLVGIADTLSVVYGTFSQDS